jgi:hypothetical protein
MCAIIAAWHSRNKVVGYLMYHHYLSSALAFCVFNRPRHVCYESIAGIARCSPHRFPTHWCTAFLAILHDVLCVLPASGHVAFLLQRMQAVSYYLLRGPLEPSKAISSHANPWYLPSTYDCTHLLSCSMTGLLFTRSCLQYSLTGIHFASAISCMHKRCAPLHM